MRFARRFLMFWYDFIVGDDVTVAICVAACLAATALLAHEGVSAWWLLPIVTAVTLGVSLQRAARAARRKR